MKNIEILSVEPTSMGKYWVVSYKNSSGEEEKEVIAATDYNEAVVKFRNLMIQQAKVK